MLSVIHALNNMGGLDFRLAHYDAHKAFLADPSPYGVRIVMSGPLTRPPAEGAGSHDDRPDADPDRACRGFLPFRWRKQELAPAHRRRAGDLCGRRDRRGARAHERADRPARHHGCHDARRESGLFAASGITNESRRDRQCVFSTPGAAPSLIVNIEKHRDEMIGMVRRLIPAMRCEP
jgi:hypothetical protein